MDNNTIKIKCCNEDLEFKLLKGASWQEYVPEVAICSKCNSYFEKKPINNFAYKANRDKTRYECTSCGGHIQAEKVCHPIHWREWGCSGGGEVKYEQMPYCP